MSSTIASNLVARMLEYGVARGLRRSHLVRDSGLTEASFRRRDGRLPDVVAFELLAQLAAQLKEPSVALGIAQSARIEQLNVLGFALMTAGDLRQTLDRLVANAALITDSGRWSYVERAELVEVRWERFGAFRRGMTLANELAIATFVQQMRGVAAGPHFAPRRVTFAHRAPEDASAYASFFRCPVRFSARVDGLAFPSSMLSHKPRLAAEVLGGFLGRLADEAAGEIASAQGAELEALKAAIRDELEGGLPRMGHLAKRLGASERTLRRKLEAAGRSFRELVEEVRRARAGQLLATSTLSVAEVALEVGFSDSPAFSRAFRRWTGESPRAYRSRLTQR